MRALDLIGQKFNHLTVIDKAGYRNSKKENLWLCKCDCGSPKKIKTTGSKLKNNLTKSCGCHKSKRGNKSIHWGGYEEISGKLWSQYQRGAKQRNIDFNLTIEEAWSKFIDQDRKCALTGQELYFAPSDLEKELRTASLDRINSKVGYILSNIQWIHRDFNKFKLDYGINTFKALCKKITKYNKTKLVIVTGSQGFLGTAICNELLKYNYGVVGIDNYSKYGKIKRKHDKHPLFELYNYDIISEYNLVKDIINLLEPEYIIHASARIGGIQYFHENPATIIMDNCEMDRNIIDISVNLCSNLKRFIAISSSMVFENTKVFPTPESEILNTVVPSSSYGFSKLNLEYMTRAANQQYNLNYTIIRPYNASGIGEEDFLQNKSSHVIPDLIVKCLKNPSKLEILGDGNQVRCFTSSKDIARGIRLALESDNGINEDFNISTNISTSIYELAEKIWKKIQPNKPFKFVSTSPYQYDVQKRIPCTKKAERLLGFEAKISLDESIDEVIQYIRDKLNQ